MIISQVDAYLKKALKGLDAAEALAALRFISESPTRVLPIILRRSGDPYRIRVHIYGDDSDGDNARADALDILYELIMVCVGHSADNFTDAVALLNQVGTPDHSGGAHPID